MLIMKVGDAKEPGIHNILGFLDDSFCGGAVIVIGDEGGDKKRRADGEAKDGGKKVAKKDLFKDRGDQ